MTVTVQQLIKLADVFNVAKQSQPGTPPGMWRQEFVKAASSCLPEGFNEAVATLSALGWHWGGTKWEAPPPVAPLVANVPLTAWLKQRGSDTLKDLADYIAGVAP
jgi:hypothetical protein